ncbi:MAG: CoA transferase [Dehalococcoidia bacterium]|nr:CoA transferase [Dehalococcoidia bacterium]
MNSLLDRIRVLDLTDDRGFLCGRILAEMGADVIKVEKPGGDPARNIGSFYHDENDPEKNLNWFAYNLNKRGITLDIASNDGWTIFLKLIKKSDIVIESFPAGYMQQMGLDYVVLKAMNPRIIMTSITPFGQTGPYRDFAASDIVVQAMSGYLHLCGDPGHPPVRISIPQAYLHACGEAAIATMMALYHRESSGEGQYVDVSAQQSIVRNTVNAVPLWLTYGEILERSGAFRVGLGKNLRARQTWACKDGFVNFLFVGGILASVAGSSGLTDWLEEEGISTDYKNRLKDFDISKFTQEEWEQMEAPVVKLFMKYTKQELFDEGNKRRVSICPVHSPEEVVNYPQLEARGFWTEIRHEELGAAIKYPGSCIRSTAMPAGQLRRAPLIGEHNVDVYHGELGLSEDEIARLKQLKII